MMLTVLGWTALVLFVLGVVGVALGQTEMGRANGPDKMGGAMVTVFAGGLVSVGVVLAFIWLVIHALD